MHRDGGDQGEQRLIRRQGHAQLHGNLPALPDARPRREWLMNEASSSGFTGYLSGLHADRIERSAKGEACEIKLLFRL